MARYITKVRTPLAPGDAFDYMADLNNFAAWDPGVRRVVQVEGTRGGAASVFDVTIKSAGRDLTLRYRTVEFDKPGNLLVRAESKMFTSIDRVTVESADTDGGSVVTYDAELLLNGPLRLADFGLKLVFRRIGDRAAAGLRPALNGQQVS